MNPPELWPDKWYEQKTEMLSEALQELLSEGDAAKAKQGLIDAIASWTNYHEEELAKWNRLKALLGL
jgi:hypothetical protein